MCENGSTSQNLILLSDEMYLQKCTEYFDGEMIGMNSEKELYKSVLSFMIIGLEQTISCLIKAALVVKLENNWRKTNIEMH